jgi:AmmeMemoRadiSam system protein A
MEQKERNLLLAIARESIEESLERVPPSTYREVDADPPDALCGEEGAFVTLKRKGFSDGAPGGLRGCIGNIIGQRPLYALVHRLAKESAFHDPRFPAVKLGELADLLIEISILTVPQEVSGPQEIVVGRDGVILSCGYHRAVFLPQVATEQGWDRHTMLDHLAMKAGLDPSGWHQRSCTFSIFQAEVFGED